MSNLDILRCYALDTKEFLGTPLTFRHGIFVM